DAPYFFSVGRSDANVEAGFADGAAQGRNCKSLGGAHLGTADFGAFGFETAVGCTGGRMIPVARKGSRRGWRRDGLGRRESIRFGRGRWYLCFAEITRRGSNFNHVARAGNALVAALKGVVRLRLRGRGTGAATVAYNSVPRRIFISRRGLLLMFELSGYGAIFFIEESRRRGRFSTRASGRPGHDLIERTG